MTYLTGATPYPPETIAEYVRQGWWQNETYVDVFERAVRRDPGREALVDDRRRLTWADLEREVHALACALAEQGVSRHDRVLIQLPNRAEYVIAFYAVQYVAAVPVLAVPRVGTSELALLFELTEPAAWFFPLRDGRRDFAAVLQALDGHQNRPRLRVVVDDGEPPPGGAIALSELMAGDPAHCRRVIDGLARPDPNDVAAIFLTGGATGRSKAVPRTHNSFLGNIRVIAASGSSDAVALASTPVAHGMANQGPLGGWIIHGSRLVMIGSPRARAVLEAVSRERVTGMALVPAQLADVLDDPELDRFDLSSVGFMATTSAQLSPELARRARAFCTSRGIRFGGSAYGCTEGPTAGHGREEPPETQLSSIGRPTSPGHRWVVLGPDEEELAPGEVGELAARGPSVFTGYYRAPEDNARIFTAAGYYRTGDQGFIDADGYIHITGRLKDIIQRGGEAVVPTEIEELAAEHPAVARVAVVAMPDTRLGERACACVTLAPGAELTLQGLVEFLRERGAGPLQWPERLEVFEALPETAVGKQDRSALRREVAARVQLDSQRRDQ
jgi:non-ribosomal peptide synthetase component E (peptide arylation enzyme)